MSELARPPAQRDGVFFSQRLSSWGGHAVFVLAVALTIASLLGASRGSQIALLALLLLLTIYGLVGTVGWRRALSQGLERAVYQYFLAQFIILALSLAFELAMGVRGLSTAILGLGLMFQASALPIRARLRLFAGLLLMVIPFYAASMHVRLLDAEQLALFLLLFGSVYGAASFLGLLVVREEQARETSLRLDESNRKLAQYAAEIEHLSTIQERNRLAREIHDNLGHFLTAVNMQLEVALTALDSESAPGRAPVLKAQLLTKEALSEIRRSISALRATPLENRTLHEAITLLVEEQRAAGSAVDFRVVGSIRPCSPVVEMAFYRIAQEGLTNVRKHAQSDSANMVLSYERPAYILLELRDNGLGSDSPDGGFGLLGIRERVQLLGGTLTIETAKGQGFVLRAEIPG